MLDVGSQVGPAVLQVGKPIGRSSLSAEVGGEDASLGLGGKIVLINVVNLVLIGIFTDDEHVVSGDVDHIIRLREIEALVANLGSNGGGETRGDGDGGTAELDDEIDEIVSSTWEGDQTHLSIHTSDIPSGREVKSVNAAAPVIRDPNMVGASSIIGV